MEPSGPFMPILSIQSHVCAGHVGNTAAVPAWQALGRAVWPVYTVLFSNHPGYGRLRGQAVDPAVVDACLQGLAEHVAWPDRAAVLSGYLGTAGVADAVADAVDRAREGRPELPYLCDPVMGDTGPGLAGPIGPGLYVEATIPSAIRDRLIPRATIAKPNQFELGLLTGRSCETLADVIDAVQALRAMGPPVVVVTSVEVPDGPEPDGARCLVADGSGVWMVATPRLRFPRAPNGAGDVLAALFLHHWLLDPRPPVALSAAVSGLFELLAETLRRGDCELALLAVGARIGAPERIWAPIRL
ncbi:pyridoxal kinase [Roseospira marina]|uniref:pyridoxal kinase n=1 Tax=Roseospira marina TaxID=140057 RepID=A0A5M6I8B3_9PROT|nr:pyridoxal kinase [Roseospira marina]KAA5604500.1 pyridoxal kinase [Roseospira marina]MBB4315556.1 pyridoxine kinase [Roseospira marina]MBB5088507.1 pyridoxine kinase [Roseospira marina]